MIGLPVLARLAHTAASIARTAKPGNIRTRQGGRGCRPADSRRNSVSETSRLQEQTRLPLAFHWRHPHHPLPMRTVRLPVTARQRTLGLEAPPWLATGPVDQP